MPRTEKSIWQSIKDGDGINDHDTDAWVMGPIAILAVFMFAAPAVCMLVR